MIEKLKTLKSINWDDTPEGLIQRHRLITDAYEKINELVDAVNGILAAQEQYATIYNEDIVPMLTPQNEEPADPYAEQRNWIGKLCWFWDDDKKDRSYDVLGYIKEGWERCYVRKGHYFAYKHCEPVSEDLIYKGGDNE